MLSTSLPSHTWFGCLGHIVVQLQLSAYPSGQPQLRLRYDSGAQEELTIEVPGFDVRAYDGDHNFCRLHLVFRSPERAELLAGCDIVTLTPHSFRFGGGEPALQVVWLPTPPAWTRIFEETLAYE